jgi:Raf kinase inhibitor-like YbhB/YbcL family protein
VTAFRLTSTAFSDGAPMPREHTCDDADRSPPLAWSGSPPDTKSFTLICDDPDAPGKTWVHWVLYDLPAATRALPAGVAAHETLADLGDARQGMTDFRRVGYGGPCPPPGKPHRYYFKLYALDAPLALAPRATKADVERAMQGKVLGETRLMGTYQRSGR